MTKKINTFAPRQRRFLGAPKKKNVAAGSCRTDEQGSSGPVNADREIVTYDRDWFRAPFGFSSIIV